MTKVIKVNPLYPELDTLKVAVNVIAQGGLVAFPTETVYGLGADCFNKKAVLKIFKVKGRPPDNPLIIHICNIKQFEDLSKDVPEEAFTIIKKLWPGPLTVVVKKSSLVIDEVTASLPTVAIRMPAHPVALKLIELSKTPIAAPSANLAGRPSPTTINHVISDLMGLIDLIIDGGDTLFGVESTIIDLTTKPPTLLRPGPITVEDIERILGIKVKIPKYAKGLHEASVALAPGMKYRHYAPKARMILIELNNYENLNPLINKVREEVLQNLDKGVKVGILCSNETIKFYKDLNVIKISLGSRKNKYEIARNLFKALRKFDELNVDLIIAEGYEEKGLGLTIMNRLRKAAGFNIVKLS